MGLSLSGFLNGIASVANIATNPVGGLIGLGGNLIGGGRSSSNNSPYVPDVIERLYNPAIDAPANNGSAAMANCDVPVMMQAQQKVIHSAPAGYVVVECPKGSGNKVAMLKVVARHYGLWKPRKKPPIKVSDWQALMKADRTIKKLKMVEKKAGIIQRSRGRKR